MDYKIVKQAQDIVTKATELSQNLQNYSSNIVHGGGIDHFSFLITVFVLSCFIGYYVVWKVTPALHTPLMAITNAISSIIIIGAILACGSKTFSIATVLGFCGILLASINIFGGFIITQRMLQMFKKK